MEECLLNSLDILTFVVPPILPAALTANNAFAQKRLERKDIFCLHSKHIPLCGGIDIVAFDKVSRISGSMLLTNWWQSCCLFQCSFVPAIYVQEKKSFGVVVPYSIGFCDHANFIVSQPPWVSDQGWSRQQEWGTTWSEIWKMMKICGLAQIVSLRYCKWI